MDNQTLLDARTLFLTQPVVHLVAGLWLLMVARTGRRVEGLTLWAVANALYAAGLMLIGMRGHIPDVVSITGANGLILCGYLVTHAGVLQFTHRHLSAIVPLVAACAVILALHSWFAYVQPHTAARVAVMTAGLGLLAPVTSWRLATGVEREVRPAALAVSVTYLGWSAFCLFRAAWTLTVGPEADPLYGDAVQKLSTLIAIIVAIGASQGYLWMAGMRLESELFRQSRRDPLTGVVNRRGAWEMADQEVARAARNGRPLSVLLLDLDRFKVLNDLHGHAAGDRALVALTAAVQPLLRRTDLLARAGGEEFVVLLPETAKSDAVAVAERIRAAVADVRVPHGEEMLGVTASIGVSTLGEDGEGWEPLLAAADRALYRAKNLGRNQVAAALRGALAAEA